MWLVVLKKDSVICEQIALLSAYQIARIAKSDYDFKVDMIKNKIWMPTKR